MSLIWIGGAPRVGFFLHLVNINQEVNRQSPITGYNSMVNHVVNINQVQKNQVLGLFFVKPAGVVLITMK